MSSFHSFFVCSFRLEVYADVEVNWDAFGGVRNRLHYTHYSSGYSKDSWRTYPDLGSSYVRFDHSLHVSSFQLAGIIEGAAEGRGRGKQGKCR